MSLLEQADRMLRGLGKSLHGKGVRYSGPGELELEYKEVLFSLVCKPGDDCLLVHARIRQLTQPQLTIDIMEQLLGANFYQQETGSGTLGLEASTNTLYLVQRLTLPLPTPVKSDSALPPVLARMASVAHWAGRLFDAAPSAQAKARPRAERLA